MRADVLDGGSQAGSAGGAATDGDDSAGGGFFGEGLAEEGDDAVGAVVVDGHEGFAVGDELAGLTEEIAEHAIDGGEQGGGPLVIGERVVETGQVGDQVGGDGAGMVGGGGGGGFEGLEAEFDLLDGDGLFVDLGLEEVTGAAAEVDDVGGDDTVAEERFVAGDITMGEFETHAGGGEFGAGTDQVDAEPFELDGVFVGEGGGRGEAGEFEAGLEEVETGGGVAGLDDGDGVPALHAGVGRDEEGGDGGGLGAGDEGAMTFGDADGGTTAAGVAEQEDDGHRCGREGEEGHDAVGEVLDLSGKWGGDRWQTFHAVRFPRSAEPAFAP